MIGLNIVVFQKVILMRWKMIKTYGSQNRFVQILSKLRKVEKGGQDEEKILE